MGALRPLGKTPAVALFTLNQASITFAARHYSFLVERSEASHISDGLLLLLYVYLIRDNTINMLLVKDHKKCIAKEIIASATLHLQSLKRLF